MREYYENLYTYKFENVYEMHSFLKQSWQIQIK